MYKDKHVIFVTGSLCDGGAERVMSILASGCAELGADVTLVILREKKSAYPVSDKIKVVQIKSNGRFALFQRVTQLHDILRHSSAQTVIPFIPIVTLYTLIANIGIGKKIIMSERADPNISIFSKNLNIKDKIGTFLMRTIGLHKLASWTVFQTPDAQAWYSKKVQEKSCIILNPLDTESLPLPYEGVREKRIVAVGRFSEEKNFPMLIKGFEIFHKTHPEYTMTIYGEGGLRKELEDQISQAGLEMSIDLPGFSSSLAQDIVRAGMYISTSNHEGISNSMLEALGMGIPTIVTDCPVGGARLFVHTDENGILIPMNDVGALVESMSKIAEESAFARRISAKASSIRAQLKADTICKQWLDLV